MSRRKPAHLGNEPDANTTGLPYTDENVNLDVPFAHPEDRRAYVHELWVAEYEREERERQADAMQQAADMGRALLEREDDELEAMRFGPEVNELLTRVIPDRAARRARAKHLLATLRGESRIVEVRHGGVRVWPAVSPDVAAQVAEYAGEIADELDGENP